VFLAIKGRVGMAGGLTLRERARGIMRPYLPMRGLNNYYIGQIIFQSRQECLYVTTSPTLCLLKGYLTTTWNRK
jgi:hypothetical protein